MALAKVSKINIIAHQNHQADFLEALQNLGFIQIEENPQTGLTKNSLIQNLSEIDYQLAGIKFCLDFLANYETGKKSLKEIIDPKISLSDIEVKKIINNFDYQAKVREIQEIESGINEANSAKEKLTIELGQIKPWQKLDFVPNRQKLKTKFDFKFISVSNVIYQNLINDLQKKLPLSVIEEIDDVQKETLAVIFFPKNKENIIAEILTTFNIKTTELPDLEVSIPERIKGINQKINEAENRIEKLTKEAQRLATDQRNLKIVFDFLTWQKEKLAGQQKTANTWQTFSLIGWIDQSLMKILEKELDKITDDFIIEELPLDQEESVPIIFKNSWAKPFESVTEMYGAPQSSEPDPTPYLAPFFVLFFGLCLTDAGYGLVLTALSLVILKILKLPKSSQKLLKILLAGGILTVIAGALTGGWFGILIDKIGIDWLKNLLVGIRLIDPVAEPIKMLLFCLGLGIIQVIFGIFVSFYWKIKNRNLKDAFLGEALWLYFIFSLLFWTATKTGLIEFSQAKYLVWTGILALILTQGRNAKNPILKLGIGIISLYGLVGYISDVLSYSRLLALGLATGIIAMVINLIARLTVEMIPYFGWLIAVFILIGGHTFNIAINVLGAYIHSSRLQFVEFFPKFMEGGGRIFQPFQKENKYIRIIK